MDVIAERIVIVVLCELPFTGPNEDAGENGAVSVAKDAVRVRVYPGTDNTEPEADKNGGARDGAFWGEKGRCHTKN